ncbi:MAG: arylsulfatase [Verrucomicrobiales bacterium]|nr:arylsulfatase [Verrucomicrobiales bacterium]
MHRRKGQLCLAVVMASMFRFRPLARFFFIVSSFGTSLGASLAAGGQTSAPPNFLVILADDLGFSDLGCYGSEIATPNLDALAADGLRFTQYYNTARCWPTRGALLTGYYPQQIRRDGGPGWEGKEYGGRGIRPSWAVLLPQRLKPLGYRSYHIGKWHVDGEPVASGFDRSYYVKDQGRYFNPKKLSLDDQPLPPVKPNSGFYATISLADHAIEFLQQHASQHADQPFFTYLAFAAPHFPLHALPEDIAKYRDRYLAGWDALRKERAARQRELGFHVGDLSATEPDIGPPYDFPESMEILGPDEVNRPLPWEKLTASQQRFQATKMAIHAAMIDRMDQEIGRVIQQLKAMDAFSNTLILFLSDNGASAEIMVRDDGHDPTAPMGSAATYLCLGPGFSSAANTPFRRHKTWVHEGGISTPFIAHWPQGISDGGSFRHSPSHVIDITPTLVDLAGGQAKPWPGGPPLPGHSLRSTFAADPAATAEPRTLFFYHEGNRALRQGDWKIVADNQTQAWSLYNLVKDRSEQHDQATDEPDRVKAMSATFDQMGAKFHRQMGEAAE